MVRALRHSQWPFLMAADSSLSTSWALLDLPSAFDTNLKLNPTTSIWLHSVHPFKIPKYQLNSRSHWCGPVFSPQLLLFVIYLLHLCLIACKIYFDRRVWHLNKPLRDSSPASDVLLSGNKSREPPLQLNSNYTFIFVLYLCLLSVTLSIFLPLWSLGSWHVLIFSLSQRRLMDFILTVVWIHFQ